MVFIVNVAADIYGRKHNIRLEFPLSPTINELINSVESQYDITARATRPAGYPDLPFRVQTFQVYDDVLLRWIDLYSSAQLMSGCQVYAFQPDSQWTVDVQGPIPAARDTITWSSSVGSPRRARIAADSGAPPSLSEKLRSVFYDLDNSGKGYVNYIDLRTAFARYDIEFAFATVGELFNEADRNRDGNISYEEWVQFSISHPQIVDALFFRSRDIQTDYSRITSTSFTEELAAQRRLRELELERIYREQQHTAERFRAQQEYNEAHREAELAHSRALAAKERERLALDRLAYAPTSPSRLFGR
jgi:hypothetical protein